jgi:hypothetical protein
VSKSNLNQFMENASQTGASAGKTVGAAGGVALDVVHEANRKAKETGEKVGKTAIDAVGNVGKMLSKSSILAAPIAGGKLAFDGIKKGAEAVAEASEKTVKTAQGAALGAVAGAKNGFEGKDASASLSTLGGGYGAIKDREAKEPVKEIKDNSLTPDAIERFGNKHTSLGGTPKSVEKSTEASTDKKLSFKDDPMAQAAKVASLEKASKAKTQSLGQALMKDNDGPELA